MAAGTAGGNQCSYWNTGSPGNQETAPGSEHPTLGSIPPSSSIYLLSFRLGSTRLPRDAIFPYQSGNTFCFKQGLRRFKTAEVGPLTDWAEIRVCDKNLTASDMNITQRQRSLGIYHELQHGGCVWCIVGSGRPVCRTHHAAGRGWRAGSCRCGSAASRSRPPRPGGTHTCWRPRPRQTCSLQLEREGAANQTAPHTAQHQGRCHHSHKEHTFSRHIPLFQPKASPVCVSVCVHSVYSHTHSHTRTCIQTHPYT